MSIYGNFLNEAYILESADISTIKKEYGRIMGHLLKLEYIKPQLTGWIGSIASAASNINKAWKSKYRNEIDNNFMQEAYEIGLNSHAQKDNPNTVFPATIPSIYNSYENLKDYKWLANYLMNIVDEDLKETVRKSSILGPYVKN